MRAVPVRAPKEERTLRRPQSDSSDSVKASPKENFVSLGRKRRRGAAPSYADRSSDDEGRAEPMVVDVSDGDDNLPCRAAKVNDVDELKSFIEREGSKWGEEHCLWADDFAHAVIAQVTVLVLLKF